MCIKHCKANDPFNVLQHIGENAYKIDLSNSYGILNTSNVACLSLYHSDLRMNLFHLGEIETGVSLYNDFKKFKVLTLAFSLSMKES